MKTLKNLSLVMLLLCTFTLMGNTAGTIKKEARSTITQRYFDGTFVYYVEFDADYINNPQVIDVTIDGCTVVAFLNTQITYDALTGYYTVKRFKIKFWDGPNYHEYFIPNMVLDY